MSTMKVCRKCNVEKLLEEFSPQTSACKSCKREYQKNRSLSHPEKARAAEKKWREANPQKVSEMRKRDREKRKDQLSLLYKEWAEKNADRIAKYRASWLERNPETHRVHAAIRRARVRAVGGKYTISDVRSILKNQSGICALCKVDVTDGYEVDHIIPISKGGDNSAKNIQILCAPCNRRKFNKIQVVSNQLSEVRF